jgi:hypothetical protein
LKRKRLLAPEFSFQIQADALDNGAHSLQSVPDAFTIGIVDAGQALLPVDDRFPGFPDRAERVATIPGGVVHLRIGKESERRVEIGLDEIVLHMDFASQPSLTRHRAPLNCDQSKPKISRLLRVRRGKAENFAMVAHGPLLMGLAYKIAEWAGSAKQHKTGVAISLEVRDRH